MKNQTVNAGVNTANGIEFQKHCALYYLFEWYECIRDKKYFVFIEHTEDVLFCFVDEENNIYFIEALQAKKSSDPWNSMPTICEIIRKVTQVGLDLYEDSTKKSECYTHNLSFVTNNAVKLSSNGKKDEKKYLTINEFNESIQYKEIDKKIKEKIEKELNTEEKDELNNVYIRYIDLPKQHKNQKNMLIQKCKDIFNNKVVDYEAAIDTLLLLFREIENNVNNGNKARLSDEKKRVSSEVINNGINIITTKKLAFQLWRSEIKDMCIKLRIKIRERKQFEMNFESSFDRFKDLCQVEHITILNFVREKMVNCDLVDEVECIEWLYQEFIDIRYSQLDELSIKAGIYAAYIEVREVL